MYQKNFITVKCHCGNTHFSKVNEFHYRPILGLAEALQKYYCHSCKSVFSIIEMQELGAKQHGKTTD
jgi:transposase-like protein